MSRAEPLVFVFTPRAGIWNHRYLIPSRLNHLTSSNELGEIASTILQDGGADDVRARMRQVEQKSTGRKGAEIVAIRDSRISRLSRFVEVDNWLEDKLLQLDSMLDGTAQEQLQSVNMESSLVVPVDELNRWQSEANSLLTKHAGTRQGVANRPGKSARHERVRHTSSQKAATKKRGRSVSWWGIVAIVVAGIVLGVLFDLSFDKKDQPKPPSPPNSSRDWRSLFETPPDDPPLAILYIQDGLPNEWEAYKQENRGRVAISPDIEHQLDEVENGELVVLIGAQTNDQRNKDLKSFLESLKVNNSRVPEFREVLAAFAKLKIAVARRFGNDLNIDSSSLSDFLKSIQNIRTDHGNEYRDEILHWRPLFLYDGDVLSLIHI